MIVTSVKNAEQMLLQAGCAARACRILFIAVESSQRMLSMV